MPFENLQVPGYLEPPTQAQREQLDMLESQARDKAALMMRKQVGLARMQAQAAQLQANGVEPLTARKTALIDNAHLLFADNPMAIVNLTKNEEADAIKQRAQDMLYNYRSASLDFRQQELDRRLALSDEVNKLRRDKQISDDTWRRFETENKLMQRELDASKEEARRMRDDRRDTETARHNKATETKPSSKPDPVKAAKIAALRAGLVDAEKKLGEAHSAASGTRDEAAWGDVKKWLDRKRMLKQQLDQLDTADEPAAAEPAAAPEPTATPAAAPATAKPVPRLGSIVIQNGKRYRYQGGAADDPSSYVEVK